MELNLNAIDALLAIVVLLGIWGGWQRGFVVATLQLLTLVASLLMALAGYHYPAAWLETQVPEMGPWAAPLSFVAIFILAQMVIGAIESRLIRAVSPQAHAHAGNRLLGLAPGAVNGLINATVVSLLLMTVPLFDGLSSMARDSRVASLLAAPAQWLEARISPIFDPAIRRTLQALTVPVESTRFVKLPYTVTQPRVRPDLEARMLQMVNAERTQRGLRPLQADPELAEVARSHSRDMFARGYFSHVTPEPEKHGPFDRMRRDKVRFLLAGENLALAHSLPVAHQGLMDSPGHRANLLRPQFGRLGIGVLDGGRHGLMVTQNFRN